jgi:MFS family permease
MGGAMIANATGTLADITDQDSRALVFSIWSVGPMNGPITGPLIGGFVYQCLGWRWTSWLVFIVAGVAWAAMIPIRETYAPAILRRRAARRRRDTGDDRWWCRYDQRMPMGQALKINLLRPFVLAATEPILWFWNVYIATVYGTLYLCFIAYPLIFGGIRGWSPGLQGLSFAGVGLGTSM